MRNGVLTDRDHEVLSELPTDKWVRLMDIGGTNGSHHGSTVGKLIRFGLAERRERGGSMAGIRTTWEYRSVDMVRQAIAHVRTLAGYECAGIDQVPDDTRLCGKCGPCEAGAFLRLYGLSK